jgi:hypothetical protein
MCFVWIWEQTAIISLYSINWLVCITEKECVFCAVRSEHLTFTNSTFCQRSVFMCFVWIWEQTAIFSLYNINWLVCITQAESVYCAVRSYSSNHTNSFLLKRLILISVPSKSDFDFSGIQSLIICLFYVLSIVAVIIYVLFIWSQNSCDIFLWSEGRLSNYPHSTVYRL